MQFWKDNKITGEFEMPATEVAERFLAWFRAEPGADDASREGLPLERLLRWWLSAPQGL